MEYTRLCFVIGILCTLVTASYGGHMCYQFSDNGRLTFKDDIDISSKAHFKLSFSTSEASGVLYYAEGQYSWDTVYDYEGLYIVDGYLHYFIFNPPPFGIGSSSGFHGVSNVTVNDSEFHEVEFFRNREVETKSVDGTTTFEHQTGLRLDDVDMAIDKRWLKEIKILEPIILGEDPRREERSGTIGGFRGRINDFQELTQAHKFVIPFETSGVVERCI